MTERDMMGDVKADDTIPPDTLTSTIPSPPEFVVGVDLGYGDDCMTATILRREGERYVVEGVELEPPQTTLERFALRETRVSLEGFEDIDLAAEHLDDE
jgi:hypothetical protein